MRNFVSICSTTFPADPTNYANNIRNAIMKTKALPRSLSACIALFAIAAKVGAADLYFDIDANTADIDGGVGNWTDANWKTTPGGTSPTTWSTNDSAFFNPIQGSPETTTVTLDGTQTATAVTFNGAGYTLTGGTLALAGTGASNWINMNANGTIGSALGHLRFRGTGEATISGGGTISGRGILGDGGGNLVTVRQTGGAVTIGSDWLMIGGNGVANSQGHYILDDGTLTVSRGIYMGWNGNGSAGTFTQNGGTLETQDNDQGIQLGIGGGTGTYNLNGGTLLSTFGRFGAPYAGSFNFGGGTFQARGSFNTNFQTGVATTIADGATARINTNGHTVTWSTALTGAAAAGLVKTGGGTLVLSGDNSFAGDIEAEGGTIRAGHANAFGGTTGTVIASGFSSSSGAIDLNGFSFDNNFEIRDRAAGPGAAGALQNTNTSETSVINGTLTIAGEHYLGGNGNVTLNGLVSGGLPTQYSFYKQGTGTWIFANENNTFDGFYYQIGGTTEVTRLANLGENSSLGRPTNATMNRVLFGFNGSGGGTLRFVGESASTSDRVFILQGATAEANNTIDASGVTADDTLTLTGGLSAGRSGNYTLALGGTNTGANEYAGIISDGSGIVALTKQNEGKWILSGANAYTGATTIAAGVLVVNGSLGATETTVESGAVLAGSGTLGGPVNVLGGGTVSPGNSIGSLAVGNLSMASGSSFVFEAQDASATGADLLVAGTLALAGANLDLSGANLDSAIWNVGEKLTLISYIGDALTSGFSGFDDNTTYLFGANEWLFRYADDTAGSNFASEAIGDHFVTLTVIPEPSIALLAPFGLLALLRRRRVNCDI